MDESMETREHKPLPVRTRRLLLRHFVPEDAPVARVLSNEEASRVGLPSQVLDDDAHATAVLGHLIDCYSTPADPRLGPYVLAIEHRADHRLIGHVGFSPFDDDVEIGFAIAQDYQRQGLATEAIVAASRWIFEVFELDRVLGITSRANIASQRSLSRARFTCEGERVMNFQGVEQSVCVYTLHRESGPAHQVSS